MNKKTVGQLTDQASQSSESAGPAPRAEFSGSGPTAPGLTTAQTVSYLADLLRELHRLAEPVGDRRLGEHLRAALAVADGLARADRAAESAD